jgi:uncharacterized protein YlxP (DUF503 family)
MSVASVHGVMVVGVCRVTFALRGIDSLKGKRSIVRRIVDRTRGKFNAAVAEVADMDSHRRAVIGVSVVSNDARHANSMLDHISSYMASLTEASMLERTLEILHTNGEPMPLSAAGTSLDDAPDWDEERDDDA